MRHPFTMPAPMPHATPAADRAAPAGVLLAAAACVWAGGCEPAEEPDFAPSAAYVSLLEEARTGTRAEVLDEETGEPVERDLPGFDAALRDRFGTPDAPAVLTALPVRFGGGEAVFADVAPGDPAEDGTFSAAVTLDPPEDADADAPALAPGDVLHWTDFDGVPHSQAVAAGGDGAVTLTGLTDATAPAPGDRAYVGEPDFLTLGRQVYVAQCAHCHGTTGAGDGPTAKYLYPKPRNYHPGLYKFTSTGGATPTRGDLTKILREGIPGTYMPAFSPYSLDETQMAAVVEYVRWLSMRGATERGIVAGVGGIFVPTATTLAERIEGGETREDIVAEVVEYWADNVSIPAAEATAAAADQWAEIEEEDAITPEVPYPAERFADADQKRASVLRGRDLFLEDRTKCVSCHGTRGLGNGPQTVAQMENEVTGEPYPAVGLHDVWDEPIRPRNLTRGIYRGGRRPVDLYRRLHSGIDASKMPGFGQVLEDEEIWDLVNFVLALPLEPGLLDELDLPASGENGPPPQGASPQSPVTASL